MSEKPKAGQDLPGEGNLEGILTFRLARLQAALTVHASRYLAAHAPLTINQYRILYMLNRDGQGTMSDLAQKAQMDKALASRAISAMVQDGLLRSEADSTDSRVNNLSMTEEGREVYARADEPMRRRRQMLEKDITFDEKTQLLDVLTRIEQAMKDMPV